jgi:nicotinamide riboside kinase
MKIAIVGAECTGKTTLANALAQAMCEKHGSAVVVPEVLREWCAKHGRTPHPQEQRAIAEQQAQRIASAGPAGPAAFIIADTTPLMTAVYSEVLFGDLSLYAIALEHHRHYDLTLLTSPDLPWVADGIQRDGPQARISVDSCLRAVLEAHSIAYTAIDGPQPQRLALAMQTIAQQI